MPHILVYASQDRRQWFCKTRNSKIGSRSACALSARMPRADSSALAARRVNKLYLDIFSREETLFKGVYRVY